MPRELSAKEKAAFAANPAFEKAAERESKQLLKKPDNTELLDLYGSSSLPNLTGPFLRNLLVGEHTPTTTPVYYSLYKVGCGEDVTEYQKGPKAPGMFDLKNQTLLEDRRDSIPTNLRARDTTFRARNGKRRAVELINFHQMQGKAKLRAWEGILADGLTPEQAQERYIALVEELKTKHGFDPEKEPEVVGS
ncbi:hypothetical protein EKO27_g5559 [Xylaria grammica]|uniref:Uncharacterized protein n=1 Tax=Xylaria grammica TaxID=363999 RepID=A0A439D545_9PEZI|nr:hypothetical protein EKO27_g5559 [Xylaria grammica]